jgi:hypothetical protein
LAVERGLAEFAAVMTGLPGTAKSFDGTEERNSPAPFD